MHLKRGISVYSDLPGIKSQIFINGGTVPAMGDSHVTYYPGSYVPKRDWRNLNKQEASTLMARSKKGDFSVRIYVGEVPFSLKECFSSLGLYECKQLDDVLPKVKESEMAVKGVSRELELLLAPFSSERQYKFHRITRAMPDRETITCHFIEDEFIYVGLHIDQSRHFTPHTARKSGNRISINLSKESRSLTFINLSLIQVYNMLKEKNGVELTKINSDNIAYHFFKHYPDYPTIKIDLKPYQYYVAPTDNFFHDASTLGNEEIDITIVYTGVFDTAS